MSKAIQDAQCIVIKVGSTLVTNRGQGLDHAAIGRWAAQMAELRTMGKQVVMVSSGAIAEGMQRLNWTKRPTDIHELQAAAAVGQMGLVQVYETCFAQYGIRTAQVLLTNADLADEQRNQNARMTLLTLLKHGVVPIINENDTVVTDEIKFGDNDTLGALVTNLIEADALIILTDQGGLFSADPRNDSNAHLIQEAQAGGEAASPQPCHAPPAAVAPTAVPAHGPRPIPCAVGLCGAGRTDTNDRRGCFDDPSYRR